MRGAHYCDWDLMLCVEFDFVVRRASYYCGWGSILFWLELNVGVGVIAGKCGVK